jgi:predicted kinase
MKSLSLSRPLVITLIGLPGSGKSFFARQFADMFGAPLVSVDHIRHTISPDSHYNPQEDLLINELAHSQIVELLKTGKTFLIDGGLNHRPSRLAVERLASKNGYGKLTIWVQTDEPTSISRSMRRSDKRPTDALNAPMDSDMFMRYKKQFTVPSPSENVIVISGKHTFATQARVVLKKLVSPRDTAVTVRQGIPPRDKPQPDQSSDAEPRRRTVQIN